MTRDDLTAEEQMAAHWRYRHRVLTDDEMTVFLDLSMANIDYRYRDPHHRAHAIALRAVFARRREAEQ